MSTEQKRVFETMNGLRGIAALVVVVGHCAAVGWFSGPIAAGFVEYGSLAVDLFFVMSGFVIAHAYGDRLSAGMSLRNFLRIRFIRLYPLYILGILIGCLTPLVSIVRNGHVLDRQFDAVASVPFSLAMLPSPIAANASQMLYPLNAPAWSLFLELGINLVYAWTWRRWTAKNVLLVMALSAAGLAWCHNVTGGWNWATLAAGLLRVSYSFPAGVLLYSLYRRSQEVRSPSLALPVGILALCGLALAASPLSAFWLKTYIILALSPASIWVSCHVTLGRLLDSISAKLGAASYAVYALHDPVLTLANNTAMAMGVSNPSAMFGALFVAAVVPFCLLTDRLYDGPCRELMRRMIPAKIEQRASEVSVIEFQTNTAA